MCWGRDCYHNPIVHWTNVNNLTVSYMNVTLAMWSIRRHVTICRVENSLFCCRQIDKQKWFAKICYMLIILTPDAKKGILISLFWRRCLFFFVSVATYLFFVVAPILMRFIHSKAIFLAGVLNYAWQKPVQQFFRVSYLSYFFTLLKKSKECFQITWTKTRAAISL